MQRIWVVLAFVLVFSWAYAQDQNQDQTDELNEVIIRGNRLETPFNELARDIQVITQAEISKLPAHSLNELLAYVGGVDIRQRGPFGGQADISMDGGTFEQTLVLIDGIKLIDDQTAHLMMNIPVPLDAIDHIEILRGAAARIYGVNALTGAINIVTRKSNSSFLIANLNLGSAFKQREEENKKGIYGGGNLQLTGNYGDKKQHHLFAVSQDLYNGQRYNTALNNSRLFYSGKYKFNARHSLQAMAGHTHNRYGANGFYAAPGDKDAEEISETSVFSLSSTHRWKNFTLQPRLSNRYDTDDYRYFKHDLENARSMHYTNAFMAELNARITTSIGDFGVGWESRFSQINSSNIGTHSRDNHGVYTEYKGEFGEEWRMTAGAYINYNTDYGWQTYPGLDLAFVPNQHWKISASLGSAQRLPSFTDLYIDQAPGNVGNPEVRPEKAWQYEVAVGYSSSLINIKGGYFYRDISRFIDWIRENEEHPYSPYNLGNNRIHGVYSRLRQNFKISSTQEFGYQIRYSYLKPRMDSPAGEQSKYILENLKHQFIVGVNYSYHDFSIQLQNRWIKRELNAGYDLLDLRLQYPLKTFLLYTDISNVLNTSYKEAGAVPMPPRWFSLGVKWGMGK